MDSATAAILDRQDCWLKATFSADSNDSASAFLQFEGLLTHAEGFLNNILILKSFNAFQAHLIDITYLLKQ